MSSSYHYLYRITNLVENRHYYGSRTCHDITPQEDIGIHYFSSSSDKSFISEQQENPENFKYKVVAVTKTRKRANELEKKIHLKFDVARNNSFYNLSIMHSGSFDTSGMVPVRDKDGNTMSVSVNDPRFLSGELLSIFKGMIAAKDKDGNIMHVSVNDPRYLSGELVHISKGMATVRDKSGNCMRVPKDDPRFISGELVGAATGANKGMVPVRDKNGNTMRVHKDDPRYLSGELVHVKKGITAVRDKDGNTMSVTIDDPRFLSGELVSVTLGTKTGMVIVKDSSNSIMRVRIDDPRVLSGELVNINKGSFWINNGTERKMIKKGDSIPEGFVTGYKFEKLVHDIFHFSD